MTLRTFTLLLALALVLGAAVLVVAFVLHPGEAPGACG